MGHLIEELIMIQFILSGRYKMSVHFVELKWVEYKWIKLNIDSEGHMLASDTTWLAWIMP